MRMKIVVMDARQLQRGAEFPPITVKLTGGNHGLVG